MDVEVISAFSQVPISSPMLRIVSSLHRWIGIPWTLIQKGIIDGKSGETVGSHRWRIIIHRA